MSIIGRKIRLSPVTLLLPAAVTLPEQKKTAVSVPIPEKGIEPPVVKKRKILVMDDEDMVRDIAGEMPQPKRKNINPKHEIRNLEKKKEKVPGKYLPWAKFLTIEDQFITISIGSIDRIF